MSLSKRIDRKQFLAWTVTSSAALALGCSDDGGATPGAGGTGSGTAGSGGAAAGVGGSAAGTFGNVAGSSSGASTGGTAGSGGSTAGSGGSTAGSGGSTAGSGGSTAGMGGGGAVPADCGTQLRVFISGNHGHEMVVTAADVIAGATKVYDTKGISPHEHWIQLTAADFTKLKAGGTVRKLSCNEGHEHEYIVNCVGLDKPETSSGIAGSCDADHKCADAMTNVCPELPASP